MLTLPFGVSKKTLLLPSSLSHSNPPLHLFILPVGSVVSKMPQNEAAAIDPLAGGSFSRLLFSNIEAEDAVKILGLDDHHRRHHLDNTNGGGASHFAFVDNRKPPKMLCFGSDYISSNINGVSAVSSTTHSTAIITDDNNNSSSPPSTTNRTTTSLSSNSNVSHRTFSFLTFLVL